MAPNVRSRLQSVSDRVVPGWLAESYAAKYAVGFLIVLVFVGTIGATVYVQVGTDLGAATEDRLESDSDLQGRVLGQWVGELRSDADIISGSDAVVSDSPNRIRVHVNAKFEGGELPPSVAAVHYLDGEGGPATTYYRGGEEVETAPGDLPWTEVDLGAFASSTGVVTEPYRSPVTGRPAVAVVSAVEGPKPRGVVLVVDLSARMAQLPRSSDTAYTHVVDDTGTIVMSHRPDQMLTQNMGPADEESVDSMAVRRGLQGETGYMEMEIMGEPTAMGFAPVPGTDWVVMTHEPTASAFALQRTVSRGILLMLVTVLIGLGALGLTLGKETIDALNVLAGKAAALESGDLDVELESRRRDEIGELFSGFDSMRASLSATIDEAETARARAEEERERSRALVEHLEEKADAYRETMAATAAGDLTRRMDPESRSETMTDIGEAFNEMADELEATLGSVKAFADTVSGASETVTASAEEVRSAGEEVSTAIQEISTGAEDQERGLREASGELDSLSAMIEEIAASADEVATTSRSAADRSQAGRAAAEAAIEDMDQIDARAEETAEAVDRLNDEMAEVGEVVELIDGIAEQTGTLALNASIEAARAGEAGKGFAVVADEVKSLAEETREATQQIEAQVAALAEQSEQSAADVRRMQEGIAGGTESVQEAATALSAIADAVEDVDVGVQDIDDATDEQAASTGEVVSTVESVTATSEQVNEESGNVAAAAEEQAASLSEVTESATWLSNRAADLREALSSFTVDEATRDADGLEPGPGQRSPAATDGGKAEGRDG